MSGACELGSTSTQVRPGASGIAWPVAVCSVIGAFSLARPHLPFTTTPLRNTQAWPDPITIGSGTTVPCESRAAVDCTPPDMTTTLAAATWVPSIRMSAWPLWLRRYCDPFHAHAAVAASYCAVTPVDRTPPLGAAAA